MTLVGVFLGPNAFNSGGSASTASSMEVRRDLCHWLEPLVVFCENELGLWDLVANSEPPITDVILGPEELDAFAAKTEALDDIVDL